MSLKRKFSLDSRSTTKSKSNSVLPGGYRNTDGSYNNLSNNANLWSSTERDTNAWNRNLNYNNTSVNRNYNNKANGFSVRCVRELISARGIILTIFSLKGKICSSRSIKFTNNKND
ncbi:MAG: hypothetical protein COV41_02640 [Candidatus Brennerbacteria bacterium CG11_big_fil_rev_8_21_14_0_20_43_10]|uniref:Fibrobacter succinogenes major paralogous domain-containing protein n=1 Tax=Candidatus Brennerbacteria bacterium CG11_big_fil_rev_8_21_14_0_20_43_10 TaxID=1974523 RepID=A0A2H0PUV3_9BACT|nr:MAG: hypothetical protein COV41_02640 [Candidatus Brennerbacteria bacterium CG11_big_fil_rev_8_21_14_0_20_43_10]